MLVILRDGRKLHGVLRSYDQFGEACSRITQRHQLPNVLLSPAALANLVLEDTVERIYHGNAFAENWRGLYLIRGENVVLLGEIVCPPRLCPSLHTYSHVQPGPRPGRRHPSETSRLERPRAIS